MKRNEILKIVLGIAIFFGVIFLYVIEFEKLNNTFRVGNLILNTFLFLLVPAIGMFFLLNKDLPSLFEKFMLGVGLLVLVVILSPLIGSRTNRMFGEQKTTIHAYKLKHISARSEQGFGLIDTMNINTDGYRLAIVTSRGDESLYIRNLQSFDMSTDSVFLPMRKGTWGFLYLNEPDR